MGEDYGSRKEMERIMQKKSRNRLARLLLIALMASCIVVPDFQYANAASNPSATGKINAKSGVYLRSKPSDKGNKVKKLKDNVKVTIKEEVFTKRKTQAKYIWYKVTVSGKTGYVRSDKIDTVKYSAVNKMTTDYLNYRNGPTISMKRAGTLKEGTKVSALLPAKLNGTSGSWYKIKKGSKYYYVSSKYTSDVQVAAAGTSSSTSSSTVSTSPVNSSSEASTQIKDEEGNDTGISISGLTYPVSINEGVGFGLKGVISSKDPISSVTVGVTDKNGKWQISETRKPNSGSFDIHSVDAKIKFGTLNAGDHIYKVTATVNGNTYNVANYTFKVVHVNGPQSIAQTAVALAWPVGTAKSKYLYKGGSATSAYKKALDVAFPNHKNWGKVTGSGASCDVFVATVCRYCGYDTSMPSARQSQAKHLKSSSKWTLVNYTYKESDLRDGDLIIYRRSNGNGHVCFYVKVNGKGCLIEAAYKDKYAYVNTSLKKVLKPASNVVELKVYRPNS